MREIKDTVSKFWATVLETGLSFGAGLLVGFLTSSVLWGLLAAAVGMFGAFMIRGQIWPIWMCGPRRDELKEGIARFQKKHLDVSQVNMRIDNRYFKLYRKESAEKLRSMRFELPWEHWRDCLENSDLRNKLTEIANEIHETETALMADVPDEVERMVQVIDYTLEAVNADLDSLELDSDVIMFDVRQPDTRKH